MPSPIELYRGVEIQIYQSTSPGDAELGRKRVIRCVCIPAGMGHLLHDDSLEGLKTQIDAVLIDDPASPKSP